MYHTSDITTQLLELIKLTTTELPNDVREALTGAVSTETEGSVARDTLGMILGNLDVAESKCTPMCQDTGTPLFFIDYPEETWSVAALRQQINASVASATKQSLLRPNAVDSLTGRNSGNNLGEGLPSLHFHEWQEPYLRIRLLLKGGGSENVGAQYSLPDTDLHAGRDLEGVRRAVLACVHQAQGRGCAPGIVGVCIGGDRSAGYIESKRQLLRPLSDTNLNPELAELEQRILDEANTLGIGPMGFGGKSTLLGVKIGSLHRLPACYFVTVSYMCWACRRRQLIIRDEGVCEYA